MSGIYDNVDAYMYAHNSLPSETDPVHDLLHPGLAARQLISTKAMKRLKNLKQLGATNIWCHPAEHTRFTHSRGVAHLAQQAGVLLYRRQKALELQANDIEVLEVAGLLHDVGHGPLSHAFQDMFMPRAYARRNMSLAWEHEDMSCKIIDHLDLEQLLGMDSTDVQRVKDCVFGEPRGKLAWQEHKFMLDIVACKQHGVDVDRMDYIARDALNCHQVHVPKGMSSRLLDSMRVVNGQLCYDYSAKDTLQAFFKARSDMHMSVYQAAKTRQAELMMMDALLLADHHMDIVQNYVENTAAYLNLDDTILSEIKRMKPENQWIRDAQDILNRLDADDLYVMCGEACIPARLHEKWTSITEEDIITHISHNSGVKLSVDDISVQNVNANMGKKGLNPLTLVPFVCSWCPSEVWREEEDAARMVQCCEERWVRVFLKKALPNADKQRYQSALLQALNQLMRGRGVQERYINTGITAAVPPALSMSRKRSRVEDGTDAGSSRGQLSSHNFTNCLGARVGLGQSSDRDDEDDFDSGTQTQYGTQLSLSQLRD